MRKRVADLVPGLAACLLWIGNDQATDPDLQVDIESVLSEEGLTGIAWSLLDEHGDVSVGTAGLRDNPNGAAFSTDTRFQVGSLTKTVLATGVLRLATEGRLGLDAPVLQYLPDLFSAVPPAGFSEITARHLLDHTAGLDDAVIHGARRRDAGKRAAVPAVDLRASQ